MHNNLKALPVIIPGYVREYIAEQAKRCGVSFDEMAAYFFVAKVVHT